MNQQTENRLLLTDTLPAFAAELRQLLIEKGELELAEQVSGLMIFDRCRCGDDFCATFYTQPKPNGGNGPGLRNFLLRPADGAPRPRVPLCPGYEQTGRFPGHREQQPVRESKLSAGISTFLRERKFMSNKFEIGMKSIRDTDN